MRGTRAGLALGVALLAPFSSAAPDPQKGPVVAMVLDTSGSIPPPELARTRQLTVALLESLPPGGEVALFTFDDQARLVLDRTSEVEPLRRAVEGIRIAGHFTALHDALYDASRYLRDAPKVPKAIVLVTDGQDENSTLNLEDALRVAQAAGIPVFSVGVGRVQERTLRRIAKLTGGQYLPGQEATAAGLATAILGVPVPTTEIGPPPSAVPPPPPAPKPAPRPASSFWMWLLLGLALVSALVILAVLRRSPHRCPTCGRALAGGLSTCAFCARAEEDPSGRTLPPIPISETVMSRLTGTEEFLEKTVTLRERPILAITAGTGAGQTFTLSMDSATSLGRAKANDIVINDLAVSSQHCHVRPEDGRFVVHDLRSTNGTFVNDRKVSRHPLAQGDVIKVGETSLQFRMDQKRL
jgi:hypothetical protein